MAYGYSWQFNPLIDNRITIYEHDQIAVHRRRDMPKDFTHKTLVFMLIGKGNIHENYRNYQEIMIYLLGATDEEIDMHILMEKMS